MTDLKPLDAIDKKILALVQVDATLAIGEIANRVGLSQTPCWKRLQRLEQTGFIKRRVAILDQAKLGLGLTVFVSIEGRRTFGADAGAFHGRRRGDGRGDGHLQDGRGC